MNNTKLLDTVKALSCLVEQAGLNEAQLLERAVPLIAALVAEDDWLPAELATPHPQYYQQHLLYGDPQDRFSLVSFVWGPARQRRYTTIPFGALLVCCGVRRSMSHFA